MPAGKPVPSFAEQIRQAQTQPTPAERLNRIHAPKVAPEVLDGLKAMAQQPITLELPLPPRKLHPNSMTKHRHEKAKLTEKARGEAEFVARQNRPTTPFKQATIQAKFYLQRGMDGQNLNAWLKATIDGLQDGGVILNDRYVTLLPPEQVTGVPVGQRRVVLTITPVI